MTDKQQETAKLLESALKLIEKQRAQLAEKTEKKEDIAIIGMDCRFPGGHNPESFWQSLINKQDSIISAPDNRWDKEYYKKIPELADPNFAGFIQQPIEMFDANFFKITPTEAEVLDPQHRLILETTWNALENACINPLKLANKKVAILVGCIQSDYRDLVLPTMDKMDPFNHFLVTGVVPGTISGRLSYFLETCGPTLNLDTACSSSLMSTALAYQYLQNNLCDLAIASGVNVILSPEVTIATAKAGMLSPDNHCKTFDETANGYARGEGCGVIVMKRLSDAVKNKDRILGIIKSIATGHNGSSSGLTVPSVRGQSALLQEALEKVKLTPKDIDYIETHGTGTSLGDPIEVNAIAKIYNKREKPLILGAVKSNIGHLESAAGVAGMVKVLLSLQHEKIPPNINFKTINPKIHLDEIPGLFPTETQNWPTGENIRRAAVSSFGYSGINAHMIFEEYKPTPKPNVHVMEPPYYGLKISAKHIESIRLMAEEYKKFILENSNINLQDFCYSANIGKADFDIRYFLPAESRDALIEQLTVLANSDKEHPNVKKNIKTAFMFTGQGSQYTGMGKLLYETQPLYKEIVDKCAALLSTYLSDNLIDILFNDKININTTVNTQPALFVLEYALAKLWMSWGVQPNYLIGHSVGEIVAATIAEVITLEDGIKLIANRAKLMQALPAGGGMAAAMINYESTLEIIRENQLTLDVAGINSPNQTIVSGDLTELDKFLEILSSKNLSAQKLTVSHAFHSRLMTKMFPEFSKAIEDIQYHPAKFPIISNVTGDFCTDNTFNTQYWLQHIESPVRFLQSMTLLEKQNPVVYLEVGPHSILTRLAQQCLTSSADKIWLSSLERGKDNWNSLLSSVGKYYESGGNVDWDGFYANYSFNKIAVPNYQFYRKRYWFHNEHFLVPTKIQNSASTVQTSHSLEEGNRKSNESIEQFIKNQFSILTKIPLNDIDSDKEFENYGIDSNMIVMLNTKLEERLGKLPATLFFKYRTIAQVSEYLEKNYTLSTVTPAVETAHTQPTNNITKDNDDSIAVIGFSGHFPQAEDIFEYWENLAAGKDCIEEIPPSRWDNSLYYSSNKDEENKTYGKWGGFIKDHDKFDAGLFNITPYIARFMTPQERLFLHSCWETFESGGYTKSRLNSINKDNQSVGIFAVTSYNDYQLWATTQWQKNNLVPINSQTFSIANRASYYFNLSGPSLTLDTACSSSLYAIHLACESLRRGECHMAVAGGVNLTLHPSKYITLAVSRFLASDGRCHSFGSGGDGYVPGEGVGSVLLKPLSLALKDKDTIYGVIKGSAVSHDGKTSGYSVPNPVAQTHAILKALEMSKVNPRNISYVEAHGTGTALGDPIEITGLTDAYENFTKDKQFCSIGSVKSNIGHLEATAGISQLIKVILQMKNRSLVPNLLHSPTTNPNIDFSITPFKVQQTLQPWQLPHDNSQRIAGISSFGAGGTNVHVIIEDYGESISPSTDVNQDYIIVLSAMTVKQLEKYCEKFITFFKKYFNQQEFLKQYTLKNIAYTLQLGREPMDARLAIVCNSIEDLKEKLAKASTALSLNKVYQEESIYINPNIKENKPTLEEADNLRSMATKWISGEKVNWDSLYGEKIKTVLLPNYPFELKRYWVSSESEKPEIYMDKTNIIEEPKEVSPPKKPQSKSGYSDYLIKLAQAPEKQQLKMITDTLAKTTAKVLGYDENTLPDTSKGFFELGIESIDIVKIQKSLEETFHCKTSDTAMFDYPTMIQFTQYLLSIIPIKEIMESLEKDQVLSQPAQETHLNTEKETPIKSNKEETDFSEVINRLEKAINKYGRKDHE